MGKSHKLPFTNSKNQYNIEPLALLHSNLWGASPVTSNNGYKYYVSFVDAYSKYTWMYLLKMKFEVFDIFKHFKSLVELQFNRKIKMLQTDWGGGRVSSSNSVF